MLHANTLVQDSAVWLWMALQDSVSGIETLVVERKPTVCIHGIMVSSYTDNLKVL